jgi:hypothetical protein
LWTLVSHSIHPVVNIKHCPVCQAALLTNVETLEKTANPVVFAPATSFEEDDQSDKEIEQMDDDDQPKTNRTKQF